MKISILIPLLIILLSCNSNETENKKLVSDKTKGFELIIGERIDGPANVRDTPNGEVLFELDDNALVDVGELEDGWYEIVIFAELEQHEHDDFKEFLIKNNRPIIQRGETIGRMKKDFSLRTVKGNGGSTVFAELHGFTNKVNIKPNTIIESAFEKGVTQNNRDLMSWKNFIKKFDLDNRDLGLGQDQIITFENAEGTVEGGPSPGPRLILFFENELLIGFFHSRDIQIKDTFTYKLVRYGSATFFEDYPEKKRIEFTEYLNQWVNSFN